MVGMAQEFEIRTRKLLESEDMRFRWDLYFPYYFLADLAILAAVITFIVWWLR